MGNNEPRKAFLICTVVSMQFTPILRYTREGDKESFKMTSIYHVWSAQLRIFVLTFID